MVWNDAPMFGIATPCTRSLGPQLRRDYQAHMCGLCLGLRDGHGLGVLVPEADDRALVHRVIYDELVRGVVSPSSRAAYQEVVTRLVDRGAAGVIAGCTEIELLLGPDDVTVPYFPTTRLHAEAAATFALQG